MGLVLDTSASQGGMIPQNDMAVAATARSLHFGVMVGPDDEAHYRRVADVPVTAISDSG